MQEKEIGQNSEQRMSALGDDIKAYPSRCLKQSANAYCVTQNELSSIIYGFQKIHSSWLR